MGALVISAVFGCFRSGNKQGQINRLSADDGSRLGGSANVLYRRALGGYGGLFD